MATRYAVGSGNWSNTTTVWSNTDGGAPGSYVPVDGDTFIISAGVSVLMDVNQSAWTGLAGTNIIRGGVNPGMLYFANGTDGYLKLRTGSVLAGTLSTNRGRLLANSDGVWGTTTALQNSNTAMIWLVGLSYINATNLDIALYCTQPTIYYVNIYSTKYDFNAETAIDTVNNTIDLGVSPPAADTPIIFLASSGATLPTPIVSERLYYVRGVSGNTFKISATTSDDYIIDLTAIGNGTCSVLLKPTDSTSTHNVYQDISADGPWSTTAPFNTVSVIDCNNQTLKTYRTSLSTKSSNSIVLAANPGSAYMAGTRVYLTSRNVAIRTTTTSSTHQVIQYTAGDTHGSVFQCSFITNTTGTTGLYGYGITNGDNHVFSGVFGGFAYVAYSFNTSTLSGLFIANLSVMFGYTSEVSGIISGCTTAFYSGGGITSSGEISATTYVVRAGAGIVASGRYRGGSVFSYNVSKGILFSGIIENFTQAFNLVTGIEITSNGVIDSISTGFYNCYGIKFEGILSNCFTQGFASSFHIIISGTIYNASNFMLDCGYVLITETGIIDSCLTSCISRCGGSIIIYGTLTNCGAYFTTPCGINYIKKGASVETVSLNRAVSNLYGNHSRLYVEDFGGVSGAMKIFDNAGDIIKTACDGTGDAPSVDPDGGNDYCLEASNIQSFCGSYDTKLVIFDEHKIWMEAGTYTITYKVQTTYAGISAGGLILSCEYLDSTGITIITDSSAIDQRSDDSDWTQTLSVTITTSDSYWVKLKMELNEYESGNEVYVWPIPEIT